MAPACSPFCRIKICKTFLLVISAFVFAHAKGEEAQGLVGTDPLVKLRKGTVGIVPCRVKISPLGVYWSRGPTYIKSETIVFIETAVTDGNGRGGPGYEDGSYNITDDFSLVITEVDFENEDFYFCDVADGTTGEMFQYETLVSIYALPQEPFPTIETCNSNSSRQSDCSIYSTEPSHNITCSIIGYTADVALSLYFRHKSGRLEEMVMMEWPIDNRTMAKSVTILVNASYYPFECIASGISGNNETIERSAAIFVRQRPFLESEKHDRRKELGTILILCVTSCVFPLLIFIVAWKGLIKSEEDIAIKFIKMLHILPVPLIAVIIGGIYVEDCFTIWPSAYLIECGSIFVLIARPVYRLLNRRETWNTCIIFTLITVDTYLLISAVWDIALLFSLLKLTDPTSPEYCHPVLIRFNIFFFSIYVLPYSIFHCIVNTRGFIEIRRRRRQQEQEQVVDA